PRAGHRTTPEILAPLRHAAMKPTTARAGLGTFAGVFTPSLMTMLGLILFLRVGYVVGSTGIVAAVVIVIVAHALAVLTTFSVAGIATNMRVKGGGDYYLISRTLGAEFGGAIGLVLFLAQAVSIGFYCMGFAEAVAAFAGSDDAAFVRGSAIAAILALAVVAWIGVDWATRLQYVVMVLMLAAFASFGLGAAAVWDPQLLHANLAPPGGD